MKGFPKRARGSSTGRPIMVLLEVLGERWTLRILWELRTRPLTFRGIGESCGGISPTLLNKRLKQLRELGLVARGDDGYVLTKDGDDLGELLLPLNRWAERWAKRLGRRD